VTNRSILGIAAIVAFGFAGQVMAQGACTGDGKINPKLKKSMGAAQDAAKASDWQGAIARSQEAEAVPVDKTEYEQFLLHEFKGIAYSNLKQYDDASKELEASVNSPCMPDADKPKRYKGLLQMAYQSKQYDKVIDFGDKALKAGGDPEIAIYVGNAYYLKNDNQNTKRVLAEYTSRQEQSNKTPDEQTYQILQSACLKLDDMPCVTEQSEKLVAHYPKQEYWQNVIYLYLQSASSDNKQLLNVMRLGAAQKALKPPQYNEMAQLAIDQGLPGEAQQVLEQGMAATTFDAKTKEISNRLLDQAKKAAALDKSTLDQQEARAKAKATGDADVKLGAAFLSYNQPDKAVEALNRGIGKGTLKDPDEAGLLLGIAYTRLNNKAEADKAFATVTKNPMMTRIAKLWTNKPT
jgi:hypothetical protein